MSKQELNTLQSCAFFIDQLVKTYSMVGIDTPRGIKVRQIVDTYLSSEFVKSTSPESINMQIYEAMKARNLEKMKIAS